MANAEKIKIDKDLEVRQIKNAYRGLLRSAKKVSEKAVVNRAIRDILCSELIIRITGLFTLPWVPVNVAKISETEHTLIMNGGKRQIFLHRRSWNIPNTARRSSGAGAAEYTQHHFLKVLKRRFNMVREFGHF